MAVIDLALPDRELIRWLEGRRFGSVTVNTIDAAREQDSEGESALVLWITLPLADEDAWTGDDLIDLQLAVRDKALEVGVQWPWHVKFRPDEDEPQEEDEHPDPPVDV